jgi:hypothetical protein
MPPEGESDETRIALLEQRVNDMWAWINDGPKSARRRLHEVQNTLSTADKLAELLKEVRRERSNQWSRWQKVGLFVFAGITSGCALVTALYVVLG